MSGSRIMRNELASPSSPASSGIGEGDLERAVAGVVVDVEDRRLDLGRLTRSIWACELRVAHDLGVVLERRRRSAAAGPVG